MTFHRNVLKLDPATEVDRITEKLRHDYLFRRTERLLENNRSPENPPGLGYGEKLGESFRTGKSRPGHRNGNGGIVHAHSSRLSGFHKELTLARDVHPADSPGQSIPPDLTLLKPQGAHQSL